MKRTTTTSHFSTSTETAHLSSVRKSWKSSFQNAQSDKDFEIVEDCVAKVFEHIVLPDIISSTIISANVQTTAPSIDAAQQYLSRYAEPAKGVVAMGSVVYAKIPSWPQEIRLFIDRSLVFADGLFLMLSTTHVGSKLTRDVLRGLNESCKEVAGKVDLSFAGPK